jgi:hypothetical protein
MSTRSKKAQKEEQWDTDVQRIIADPTLSVHAKAILVTAEIEKLLRAAPAEEVEIKLICEEVPFHSYRAAFIPRVGELVRCRLQVGKGHFATLWHVKEVEHGVGADRLWDVTISVQPADTQTAMHWQSYPKSTE